MRIILLFGLLIAPICLPAQRLIDRPVTVQKVQQAVD